ncbi:MAG: Uma2 family endonuclease [Methylococcaceae bacterium]|jgi:Uma2 family endonuclease
MAVVTKLSDLDANGFYSYADYLTWQLDETVELIKGKIIAMCPAPNVRHQRVSWQLNGALFQYFKNKKCAAFAAPFDVKLYNRQKSLLTNTETHNVIQPDLCVICDPEKLTEQGCDGAPDWIIEILSKGNSKREMQLKYALYQENGVREYWLIYPYEKAVHQFVLNERTEKYDLIAMFSDEDTVSPYLFPDLQIDLADVFAE